MPDPKPRMRISSCDKGKRSFADAIDNMNADRASVKPSSKETGNGKGHGKDDRDSDTLLGNPAAATHPSHIEKNMVSRPTGDSPAEKGTGSPPTGFGLKGEGRVQNEKSSDITSLIRNILMQAGITPEEDAGNTSLQAFLAKMGVGDNEIKEMTKMGSGVGKGTLEEAFLERLTGILEGKGLSTAEAKEMAEMLLKLQVRVNNFPSPEERQMEVLKNFLLQSGIEPAEVDEIIKGGEISPAALKKILLPLGISGEEIKEVVKGEKVSVGDLKKIFTQLGVIPENFKELVEAVEAGGKGHREVFPRGLLELLDRVVSSRGNGAADIPGGKEVLSANGNSREQGSTGNGDIKGDGHLSPGSAGTTSATASQGKADFGQVLSEINPRGAVAQKVLEQITEGAKIHVGKGQTRAKIFLQPPSLGKLHLHIVTKGEEVKVSFFAENLQVKEIIESNLSQLRHSFMQQGLRADTFDVFVGYQQGSPSSGQGEAFGTFRTRSSGGTLPEHDEQVVLGGSRQGISENRVDLFV